MTTRKHRNSRFCFYLLLSTLTTGVALAASTGGLATALQKKYPLTQTTFDKSQITQSGVTLEVKAGGIYAWPWDTLIAFENKIVDGKIQHGFMDKAMASYPNMHVFQPGDKVYVTKIETKNEPKDDLLKLTLLTCDPLDVSGSQKRYAANLAFKFQKDYLAQTAPEEVEQAVEAVLSPAADASGNDQQQAAQPAQPASPPPQPPVQVPAAPAAPPPPVAPAAPPPTISVGESSSQVLQSMGMPLQIVDLGKKKTYIYKDLKIIFLNDKVSEVQ